jgi:NTE family protein
LFVGDCEAFDYLKWKVPDKMLPIGVALSGGTARAVAHVGVLKALAEEEIPISVISATSGGSIVASLYSSGMPMSSILQTAMSMSWTKLVSLRLSRLGFVSSKRIEEFVKSVIGDVTFAELKVPCYVVATDLATGNKRVFHTGNVARAVRASCSIPQIFLPVEIDGNYYVDGGVSEYLPAETLRDLGEMFVIGVHLAQSRGIYARPRNYIQLAIHIMGLVAKTNYLKSREEVDVLIHPDTDNFSPFDFDSAEGLINLGYETTKAAIPEIRQKWKQKSSKFHKFVQKFYLRQS